MISLNSSNYHIVIEVFIDEVYRFTCKLKSEGSINDLKKTILHKIGLYSINYLLMYNFRDYTNFESFKLKEVFLGHKEVQINLKTLDMYKKGIFEIFK
jgi:hypothetical protein